MLDGGLGFHFWLRCVNTWEGEVPMFARDTSIKLNSNLGLPQCPLKNNLKKTSRYNNFVLFFWRTAVLLFIA